MPPAICSIILGVFLIQPVHAQPDVEQWVQRMVTAVHELSYEGTFVFLHGNQLETIRIKHSVDESGEKERLISMNGVPREVFRDNASITCISPDAKSVSIGSRTAGSGFKALYSLDMKQLLELYNFQFLGEQRVADRQTKVIAIIPRDQFRYGYRLYLDSDTAFPLKSDLMNAQGDPVSQIMFTHLEIEPSTTQLEEISIDGKEDYVWVQERPKMPVEQEMQSSQWRFNQLPKGYAVSLHTVNEADQASPGRVDHFVISDGLASLSVYAERHVSEGLIGHANMGTVNAFGRELNDFHITAVGEVPQVTVEHVANAIESLK